MYNVYVGTREYPHVTTSSLRRIRRIVRRYGVGVYPALYRSEPATTFRVRVGWREAPVSMEIVDYAH